MRINRQKSRSGQANAEAAASDRDAEQRESLEERLQALLEHERAARELLEQREADRLATEKEEAQRRVAAAEAALEGARAREKEQREAERKLAAMETTLADAWSQLAGVTEDLAEAKRQLEAARGEIKPRSRRKVEEAEQAVADAQAREDRERGQRIELEQRLQTIEQSQREALEELEARVPAAEIEEANQRLSAEVEEARQRVTALEETLADARTEAERERERRADAEQRLAEREETEGALRDLERRLEETERGRADAERRAERALEDMARMRAEQRERLRAIEKQVQALVGSEEPSPMAPEPVSQFEDELDEPGSNPGDEDAVRGAGDGGEPFAQPTPSLLEALDPVQRRSDEEAMEPDPVGGITTEDEPDEPATGLDETAGGGKVPVGRVRRRGRRRGAKGQMNTCAVCQRASDKRSTKQLEATGWIVAADAILCPSCQGFGWELSEEGGLPFRRSSARQPAD